LENLLQNLLIYFSFEVRKLFLLCSRATGRVRWIFNLYSAYVRISFYTGTYDLQWAYIQ